MVAGRLTSREPRRTSLGNLLLLRVVCDRVEADSERSRRIVQGRWTTFLQDTRTTCRTGAANMLYDIGVYALMRTKL